MRVWAETASVNNIEKAGVVFGDAMSVDYASRQIATVEQAAAGAVRLGDDTSTPRCVCVGGEWIGESRIGRGDRRFALTVYGQRRKEVLPASADESGIEQGRSGRVEL